MVTTDPFPQERAFVATASWRCPLCGFERSLPADMQARSATCPSCGLDLKLVGESRPKPTPAAPAAVDRAADPLDRWLAGDAIQVKSQSHWERASHWARRHPRTSLLAVLVLIAVIVVPIGSLAAYIRTAKALRQVSSERAALEKDHAQLTQTDSRKTAELKTHRERSQSQQLGQQRLENELQELQASFEQSREECQSADERLKVALRDARLSFAQELSTQAREVHKKQPETSLLLAAKSLNITLQEGAPPIPAALQQVRDLLASSDGRELRGHEGPVALLAESRDGKWLASGDHFGKVRLWATTPSTASDSSKLLDGHWDRITHLLFTADNHWLISGSADSAIRVWDLNATDPQATPYVFRGKQRRIAALAVSDDGRWLATASAGLITSDNSVRIWDLHAKDIKASAVDLPNYKGRVRALAISPDGGWLATGDDDGSLRLWRFSGPSHAVAATTLRVHLHPVRAVSFSPDGRWLITTASSDHGQGTVLASSLTATDVSADMVLAGDAGRIERLAITADSRWLITASEEPALRVWDLTALDQRHAGTLLSGQKCAVQAIAASTNGRWLATTGIDNTVLVWNITATGPAGPPISVRSSRGNVTGIAFAGQGDWLATGNDQGIIQLWSLKVEELIRTANAKVLP